MLVNHSYPTSALGDEKLTTATYILRFAYTYGDTSISFTHLPSEFFCEPAAFDVAAQNTQTDFKTCRERSTWIADAQIHPQYWSDVCTMINTTDEPLGFRGNIFTDTGFLRHRYNSEHHIFSHVYDVLIHVR